MYLRGNKSLSLRPMRPADIATVLSIIEQYDQDDVDDANETYHQGLSNQFCLCEQDQVVGVVGAKPIANTDRSFGLSWTYVDRSVRRGGQPIQMLQWVLDIIREQEGRRVFVHSSDYIDPERGDIYREARDAYNNAGFVQELKQPGYYGEDEALIIYGMRLIPKEENEIVMNLGDVRLTDVDEIPETDGAFWLAWELVDQGKGTKPQDFQKVIDQVREWDGRSIYMAFPSDVANAPSLVTAARFRACGRLIDYYEDGVDEIHYRYDL